MEAKFGYGPLRSIQEGQTRGDREVRKEMNHSPLYLANSLIGIGRSDCQIEVLGSLFSSPGAFCSMLIRTLEKLS